jgi:hypothetical protein
LVAGFSGKLLHSGICLSSSEPSHHPLIARESEAAARPSDFSNLGHDPAYKTVDDDELVGTLKYQVKDTTRPDRAKRFLPASRATMGMNHHWSTKGFWSGKSESEMWKELRNEWFGPDTKVLETCPILDMKSRTTFRDKMVLRLRSLTSEADAYLAVFPWHDTIAGAMECKCMTTD